MTRRNRAIVILAALPAAVLVALATYFALPLPAAFVRGDEFCTLAVADRNGVLLREVRSSRCGVAHWVALEQMSPWLGRAAVAAEDKRFYRHPGVDVVALGRALLSNLRARRIVSGGSTITQQLVRNIYLAPRRTVPVKFAETLEALRLELHLSKDDILEAYLNRVAFGNRTYGVDAASRLYFDRRCSELSLAQSCFLVSIPRAPAHYDPYRFYKRTRRRQLRILRTLLKQGGIDELEYETAVAESIIPAEPGSRFRAPHFVDYVLAQLEHRDVRGAGQVRTTLDWPVQQECEDLLKNQLARLQRNHATNGAVLVMDRTTGDVVAMVGSRGYFDPDAGQVNACLSLRQPGSAIKPFVYAAAFERGISPATILPDIPHFFTERGGDYTPANYDRKFHGPVSARTALGCSYNVPAVRVAEEIGPELLLATLRRVGMTSLDKDATHYGLALALGVGDVPLLQLVNAYRVLANSGEFAPARVIRSARDNRGDDIPLSREGPVRVLSPVAVFLVTNILSDNDARAPAFGEFSCLCLGFPCAVKTGTSKDFRDNWAVGYTNDYVAGVWVGNFDGSPMHRVSGVTGAGPLLRDVMLALHDVEPGGFTEPEGIVRCRVCPKSGLLPGPHCPNSVVELFAGENAPHETCDVHQLVTADRVIEVYPPAYWAWMEQNGLELPPVRSREHAARTGPAVLFPDRGDVFKIDPDVARESQSILLKAVVPAGEDEATWVMDGKELARVDRPFTLFWGLEPGRHRVRVKAGGSASEEVGFLVMP